MKNSRFPIPDFQKKRRPVSPKQRRGGFALLVSIIFMSVMLTFGLALSSLGFKQEVLASSAIGSQNAFYVADAVMECALLADQKNDFFAFPASDPATAPAMTCGGATAISATKSWSATTWIVNNRFKMDADKHCADIMVAKAATGATQVFAQGYDVPCTTVDIAGANTRFSSRGLSARY